MKKSQSLAQSLATSIIERKTASLPYDDAQMKDRRVVVMLGVDTAVRTAEELYEYMLGDLEPVEIQATTIDGVQVVVCLISHENYSFLCRWTNLEYGPEVEVNGENIRCLRLIGLKEFTASKDARRSPLSNPKLWQNAAKAYAAGHKYVLQPLPLLLKEGNVQYTTPEELQKIIGRATPPNVIHTTSVPWGEWDQNPVRQLEIHMLDPREESLLYQRTTTDGNAPLILLDGRKILCLKVKSVKPMSEWRES